MTSSVREISKFKGIEIMGEETRLLINRIKSVYNKSARDSYGQSSTPGLGVYVYGSVGRGEMVGGDADADVFILETGPTEKSRQFRELFVKRMNEFDYAKLDIPEWGKLDEAQIFLEKSLIEGNQVLETRYIAGDLNLDKELDFLKRRYNTLERALKNFIFNRFYLDDYFKNKVRNGALNVKYCEGGSRELLFFSWYDEIISLLDNSPHQEKGLPRCLIGAKTALLRERLNEEEYNSFIQAIDYMTILRSNILAVNRDTSDRGLSFLDTETMTRLKNRGYSSPESIQNSFASNREVIRTLVSRLYEDLISVLEEKYGSDWERDFNRAIDSETPSDERLRIPSHDSLMKIAKLWGANNSNQGECFHQLSQDYIASTDSGVIGSIVNSKLCLPEILDYLGRNIGREKGYGYLLRVISRNPNTPRETLIDIVNDESLEERYTSVAKAVLKEGVKGAHNQL